MSKLRVGVVRGGTSSEYEVSLQTGANILDHISKERYIPIDILISRRGEWIINGLSARPDDVATQVDLVWNALHGEFGEDGKFQRILEHHGIPYTGSQPLPSAISMHKQLSKERYQEAGLKTPAGILIGEEDDPEEAAFMIFRNFAMPLVIKPALGGSSVGISIAKNYDELLEGIVHAHELGPVLVEEFMKGREATCAVIEGGNGECYALEPIEIIPLENKSFFDYEAKYQGKSIERCPGNFTDNEKAMIQELAIRAHRALGLRHYSRSDFILTDRGISILETNSLPGLTKGSLLPKSLAVADIEIHEFIDHIIKLALRDTPHRHH